MSAVAVPTINDLEHTACRASAGFRLLLTDWPLVKSVRRDAPTPRCFLLLCVNDGLLNHSL